MSLMATRSVTRGRSQCWKVKFSSVIFKLIYREKTVLCILLKFVELTKMNSNVNDMIRDAILTCAQKLI